jgi:hypothetical protein
MNLLPESVRLCLPSLYSQEADSDPIVHVKYFTPDSSWTWYATEGEAEGDDFRFFGYVRGQESEWGYFLLSELKAARGPLGLPIERDLNFKPVRFHDIV